MKVWVLTNEVNLYDQCGEYFIAVFGKKPIESDLIKNGVPDYRVAHVLNGGGRVGDEDDWFYLNEYEV